MRARETSAELDKLGVQHALVPDSAILISDIYTPSEDPATPGHSRSGGWGSK